jgi:arylsulfatase
MAATDVAPDAELMLEFNQPISFAGTKGKTLRLYAVSDPETVLWQADPEADSPWEGKRRVEFDDLPRLQPDTSYFLLSDAGWITVGGRKGSSFNDGAFWWRFRTRPASGAPTETQ